MKKLGRSTMWSPWRWVRKIALTTGRVAVEDRVHRDAGTPHLSMGSLAAVHDVGGVPDDDRVRVAAARRLRVAAASGAEQHGSLRRVRGAGSADARRSERRATAWRGERFVRWAHSLRRAVRCVAHSGITLVGRLVSSGASVHHGGFEVSTTEVAFPGPDEIEGFWASTRCTRRGRSRRCRSTS